ncbi:MAG: hydroxymethylbilane synthase [bacterium]
MSSATLRLGTRGSRLALAQAHEVAGLLRRQHPDLAVEFITIKTSGDRDQASSLSNMSSVGVFTKTIETALRAGEIDIAVHSAKDLPSTMTEGLILGAVPVRAACEDVLISNSGHTIDSLPDSAVVGTGSPRRRALLLNRRPDLRIKGIRGNLDTRLAKLDSGEYDALVLAKAGLQRLGLEAENYLSLPPDNFVPAAGQGFLAIQAREVDIETQQLLSTIDNREAHRCLEAERLLMAALGAGCAAAVGVWARIEGDLLQLNAVVLDLVGKRRVEAAASLAAKDRIPELAEQVASDLRAQGAMELIAGDE